MAEKGSGSTCSDRIPNESSADSLEDTDFVMRKCGVCTKRAIGKSMYPCTECNLPICQSCGDSNVYIGCEYDWYSSTCSKCFKEKYGGRPRYCRKADCTCDNPSPQKKEKLKLTAQLAAETDANFRATFNVEEWKKTHPPINYPGKYKGQYLVDLFLSNDAFTKGYAKWLVEKATARPPNQTDEAYENFQHYRQEARDLLELYAKAKPAKSPKYNLRQRDKSPERK